MSRIALILTLAAAAALPALAAPASASAQAHPDLTGAWTRSDYSASVKPLDGAAPPLKPEAKAEYDKNRALAAKGDRSFDGTSECLPEGLPRLELINEPFEIMQRDKAVYFVAQNRLPWRAYFGEKLPDDPDPLYLGYTVAHWDGPVLVTDSAGFRDGTLLDDAGLPHSDALKLTSKYRLGPGGKTMTVTYTVDDPKDYTRPWSFRAAYVKKPADWQMPEEVCAAKLQSTAPKRAD